MDYLKILCVIIVEKPDLLDTLVHLGTHALEKNYSCVKQIWVKKEDLYMLKRMGPKQI